MEKYNLTIEELTVQVHRHLREINTEVNFNPKDIRDCMTADRGRITFDTSHLNRLYNVNMTEPLFKELGIEYEKNLHDKYYFKMYRETSNIIFEMMDSND